MSRHFAIESDNGIWREAVPVCGNNFRRTKKLTDDWREVDCPRCRELCGFDEQLTETVGDPFLKARAA